MEIYLSAAEAAAFLRVAKPTLYAYVSRGLIRSQPGSDSRARTYNRLDLARLRERKRIRNRPQAEVAARLWLKLPDQQPGDHFWILMDPITGQDGEPYVFYLASHDDGERRLLGRYVSSSRRFFPHREIVFGLPE